VTQMNQTSQIDNIMALAEAKLREKNGGGL
jgi:hypothetical protein